MYNGAVVQFNKKENEVFRKEMDVSRSVIRASHFITVYTTKPFSVLCDAILTECSIYTQASLQAVLQPAAIEIFEAVRSLFLQVCVCAYVVSKGIITNFNRTEQMHVKSLTRNEMEVRSIYARTNP